jgi:hypothetical protein
MKSLPDNTIHTLLLQHSVLTTVGCLKTDNATDNVTEADLIDEANETDEAKIIV